MGKGGQKVNTGLRLEPEQLQALEALAAAMSRRAGGARITWTEAARVALRRGIEVLSVEMAKNGEEGQPAGKPKR